MVERTSNMRVAVLILLLAARLASASTTSTRAAPPVHLSIDRVHTLATFDPRTAVGATIDVHNREENAQIFTRPNIAAMLSAGFQPLSYRLATELDGEAWHWNPRGSWSDAAHAQGYWTSDAISDVPLDLSYGYRLPRRGNTLDQARQDNYSRIDDGDRTTFWKSNPYLDPHFTHEPEASLPQWVLVDLGQPTRVDAVRIAWGEPYATSYVVQYWIGPDALNMPRDGVWQSFARGEVRDGRGGDLTRRLAAAPIAVRYVRVLLLAPSHTSPQTTEPPSDVRDALGFAIRELSLGTLVERRFRDAMRHAPAHDRQTVIWVSSTDPWHRATDIDTTVEQLGFDAVERTGLTRGLPMLTPAAILYGTPEDAANEVRFLRSRKYAVSQVELGEEPDGQHVAPEDYAALFLQWASAIHTVDPTLALGGPAFQSSIDYVGHWRDTKGRWGWIGRFTDYLRERKRLGDFAFFSFEWYPVDRLCSPQHPQLIRAPQLLLRMLEQWKREGLPETIPWLVTEYGWSSFTGEPEVDMTAAIFNTDFLAHYLALGRGATYFYGYEPDVLLREESCATYGNLMLFLSDEEHHIRYPLASFHAAQMVMHDWLAAEGGTHTMYRVVGSGSALTAFCVVRPDGSISLLAINKNEHATKRITIAEAEGPLHVTQFSSRDYIWKAAGENGHPIRDVPPHHTTVHAMPRDGLELPPYSITVVTWTPNRTRR